MNDKDRTRPFEVEAQRFLRAELAENQAQKILPSECGIIERLLKDTGNMHSVYAELGRNLPSKPARYAVLRRLVSVAAFWNLRQTQQVRDQVTRCRELNAQIETAARNLGELLRIRAKRCPDVQQPADHHPLDLIERAALNSSTQHLPGLFQSYLQGKLDQLGCQFDMKYWPETHELLTALADTQLSVNPEPLDSAMQTAISARSHSSADFIRALLQDLRELATQTQERGYPFYIRPGFQLSNEAIANYATAALELDPPISADAVRKVRKRFNL